MRLPAAVIVFACFTALSVASAWAQDAAPDPPKASTDLPAPFATMSPDAILKAVFPDYLTATGRVPSLLDEEDQPAKVWITEAKPWKGDHLVIMVSIAADALEASDGRCGACLGHALLAVVRRDGESIALVAKGRAPKSLNDSSSADDLIGYGGHSWISLDLAPYAMNSEETLIGLRQETIWREIRGETLALYRIEGQGLRVVFQTETSDFEYPDYAQLPRRIVKTTSTIAPAAGKATFNDFRVTRIVYRCTDRNDDDDCNAKDERVDRARTVNEVWRYNGKNYALVKGR